MPGAGGITLVRGAARFYTTIGGRRLRYRSRALQRGGGRVPVEKVYGTNTLRGLGCHCSPRQEIGRRRCRIMDRVNRGGCAKEGARVFRAGAAAQVIRDRGGADDEELIVHQADKPPRLLVALVEASAFDRLPCRLSYWRYCSENVRKEFNCEGSSSQQAAARCIRRTIAAYLRWEHLERRPISTNALLLDPAVARADAPTEQPRAQLCETAG